jgi:hypothetical protein
MAFSSPTWTPSRATKAALTGDLIYPDTEAKCHE